ncbi:hypothetical protein ACEQ8H_007033 [Pleosporales sp. CAS-2024a]
MLPIALHDSLRLPRPSKILRRTLFEELFYGSAMAPTTIDNCILLLNLPPHALAGIDLLSFTTSPRFHGIKNVPPGLHFVFAATHATMSVRHGAWLYVSPGLGSPQVFVKKWDHSTEDLVAETRQAHVLTCKANLGSIWKHGLTPYRQTVHQDDSGAEAAWSEESTAWNTLTSRITPTLLSRICGLKPDHWSLTSASSAAQDLESIPGLETSNSTLHPEKELRFLPIDLNKTWPQGATGPQRTEAAQDRSWFLGDLVDHHCQAGDQRGRELEIVGELQFAFLMVLTLNNNSCLEQWKRILALLLTCRQAIQHRSAFFLELVRTLRTQLAHCPDTDAGLFDMHDVGGGFLRPLLKRFQNNLDDLDGKWKSELVKELADLRHYLCATYGWALDNSYVKRGLLELEDGERVEMDVNGADEDDELGDYAPLVVELTPAQQRLVGGHLSGHEPEGGHLSGHEPEGGHLSGHESEGRHASGRESEDEQEADLDDMDMR